MEAATRGVLWKKVFLKISQISLENTCVEVSFNWKDTPAQMFSCEICEVFKNTYFEGHLQMTASEFIGDTTLFHETILKKHRNGKTNFQDGKEYNRRQHFEW